MRLLLAAAFVAISLPAAATSYTWNGSAGNLWSNPANWTPNGVPQSGDSLVFPERTNGGLVTTMNDLTPGQAFSIEAGSLYEIQGNEVVSASINGPTLTMKAPLRLAADAAYVIKAAAGPIDLGAHRLRLGMSSLSGAVSGTGELELPSVLCCGTYALRGTHSFSGNVTSEGVLFSDGAVMPATITARMLNGTGTFGPVTVTGHVNGVFTTGSLKIAPGATFYAQIAGGQVRVNGSVDVSDAVLARQAGFPAQGQVITIIDNDGTDPVVGTFRGLPEGAEYDSAGERFIVSYSGGDGNDVTLTAVRISKLWTGQGGNNLWSNGANWQGGIAPLDGDALRFSGSASTVNDITGLVLHSLRAPVGQFYGSAYATVSISGESVGITSFLQSPSMSARVRAMADGATIGGWLSGGIDVGNHSITVYGPVTAASPANGITGNGTITFRSLYGGISGIHPFSGTVVVDGQGGALPFNGEMPATFQVAGGLVGSGMTGALSVGSGYLQPKPFLDTRDLSIGSGATLFLEHLDEPLDVTGTVALASPALTLTKPRYVVGRPYVVIRNDGTDPISGTFANLPEGGSIKTSDTRFDFRASYVGGDGNDFTLTALTGKAYRDDFNRDGKADIMWQHRGGNGNQGLGLLHRMDMDGFTIASQETVYSEPDLAWRPVARGDFDANGVSDLLWRNMASGDVYMMLFGADGRPVGGGVVYREPDLSWKIVGAPDIDGDGRADILWAPEASTGTLYMLLMDGATIRDRGYATWGAMSSTFGAVTARASEMVATADFDGEGRDRLVVRLADGRVYAVSFSRPRDGWPLGGGATLIHTERNPDWRIVAAPDLDGDGIADLLWHNAATGMAWGMRMFRTEIRSQGPIHQAESSAWVIAAAGDYDGDGKEDILWHNEADGRVHVMLMNGLAIKDQRTIYREPDTGWKPVGLRTFQGD
jgi:hypothetical protein